MICKSVPMAAPAAARWGAVCGPMSKPKSPACTIDRHRSCGWPGATGIVWNRLRVSVAICPRHARAKKLPRAAECLVCSFTNRPAISSICGTRTAGSSPTRRCSASGRTPIRHARRYSRASQILMGTKYPFPGPKTAVDHILATPGLRDGERVAILEESAERLLAVKPAWP